VIRRAFATAVALAATLTFGVTVAVAAQPSATPLAKAAAHDGVSVPSALAHAITKKLGVTPSTAIAGASQTPAPGAGQQELQASDGMPVDLFGVTVSLTADGHTALVGAPGSTVGAAYVFAERGGKWSEQQELDSPAGSAEDSYGFAVALAGDGATAVVGAYTGNDDESGIVYSYSLKGSSYVLDGLLTAPDGAFGDEFGASVSLSGLGNVALIGAPDHNGYTGAAYVFVRGAKSWTEEREYQDPAAPGEAYGLSVSEAADGLSGVVGAPLAGDGQGAAYVFSELGSSQQTLVGTVGATDPPTSFFGLSVSIDALAGRVLVGSPFANLGDGAAFVFNTTRSGSFTQSQELVQSDPGGSDAFGYSVALDDLGNSALIGAVGKNGTAGSAYTFAGASTLSQQRELTEPAPVQGDEYGFSVAIDALGSELLIGAPYSNDAQGAAWAASNQVG
jgi:FG-GAP repeat